MAPNQKSRLGRLLVVGALAVMATAVGLWFRSAPPAPPVSRPGGILASNLVQRDGHWLWRSNTNLVFTGVMVEKFPSGGLRARVEISNGLADGWTETWHTNGQAQLREHFKRGVSDGLRQRWFEDGRKQSVAMIVDGKVDGLFERWHENGQLAEKIQMKDGQPVGVAWAYYPSGFVKAETMIEAGHPRNQKRWKDGEFKSLQ